MESASHQKLSVRVERRPNLLIRARDWLDEQGRLGWLTVMVAGFIFVWPVGLAILAYMLWSNRMFKCSNSARRHRSTENFGSSGNSAFDAYREQTLKRLEDEHDEFKAFLRKLREAKDKAEFDQFMESRDRKQDA